jgi:hypothetical protein
VGQLLWPKGTESGVALLEGIVACGENCAWSPEECSSALVCMGAAERAHSHEG